MKRLCQKVSYWSLVAPSVTDTRLRLGPDPHHPFCRLIAASPRSQTWVTNASFYSLEIVFTRILITSKCFVSPRSTFFPSPVLLACSIELFLPVSCHTESWEFLLVFYASPPSAFALPPGPFIDFQFMKFKQIFSRWTSRFHFGGPGFSPPEPGSLFLKTRLFVMSTRRSFQTAALPPETGTRSSWGSPASSGTCFCSLVVGRHFVSKPLWASPLAISGYGLCPGPSFGASAPPSSVL